MKIFINHQLQQDYDGNAKGKDYFELVNNGAFPELGSGSVDFKGVRKWQRDNNWKGWIVVEQDLLGDDKNVDKNGVSGPMMSAMRNMNYLKTLYKTDAATGSAKFEKAAVSKL